MCACGNQSSPLCHYSASKLSMTVGAEQVISVMLLHSFSHMEKECGESERQVVALQADVRGGKGEEQNYMLHYSIGLLEVPKSKVK